MFVCDTCGKSFGHRNSLRRHIEEHAQQSIYRCCGKPFQDLNHFRRHRSAVHGEATNYSCLTYPQTCPTEHQLSEHKKVEQKDDICRAHFVNRDALKKNLGMHTDEDRVMLTDENFDDLKVKGYTVIKDVLTSDECDEAISQYREWLSQFKDGLWPVSLQSIIHKYNTCHMRPTWFVRLKAKKTFAEIWKTDKLLSSFDSVAIGRPPENGEESFQKPGSHWLHVDQSAYRTGLHAYQGAIYLEEACEDDWTLQVMEGSHMHFQGLKNRKTAANNNFYKLNGEHVALMESFNCQKKRVPVPKGGMVLWDSRLVHANARPIEGRKNPGRWRFVNFVSMTPAIWATQKDIAQKRKAYRSVSSTTHWSSQGVTVKMFDPTKLPKTQQQISYQTELPDIAKTQEAKLLSGVNEYNFEDGNPTGIELEPKWDFRR